jgi:hypothetical protein
MWDPHNYQLASWLTIKLLGAIYLFAWWPFVFQIKGLLGKNGILPIDKYLKIIYSYRGKKAYLLVPSLFWINSSDKALQALVWAGILCSILLLLGVYPAVMLLLLYILFLSLVSTGQSFLSFGWDVLILEFTANCFLLSLTPVPNPLIWISINLLVFRLHFQGGAVKLQSRDPNWRNLTAVYYHYQSQPLPNTIAWYVYRLPMIFHKICCVLALFVEILVPFAFFGTAEMRLIAWILVVGLQIVLWATGNFCYLNHFTVVMATILLSDAYLGYFFSLPATIPESIFALDVFLYAAGAFLITLQLGNLYEHFFYKSIPLLTPVEQAIAPFHLVNRYGLFAVMTTKRYEIVVEGSADGNEWHEYLFRYKPSELNRRPRRISPYQPRLDWQAWFLPFRSYNNEVWFHNFLVQLLEGRPEVIGLLRHCPFPNLPPQYIRAVMYDYEFTDFEQKKQTGNWWTRQYVGQFSPTLKLKK